MTTTTSPTYVPGVSLYFADRGMMGSVTIAEALTRRGRSGAVLADEATLILGRMQDGYLGREVVTADDLRRWDHESETAAQWADVTAGERFESCNHFWVGITGTNDYECRTCGDLRADARP